MRQMRILCLLFLSVLALVFPLFSFSFVEKGRILSNLLTLSGALLSCPHHESFHPKFSWFFCCCCFFYFFVPVFCAGISRLGLLPMDPLEYIFFFFFFAACLFVATGYCDHVFYPSCLSRGQ